MGKESMTVDNATDAGALLACTSPWWLPSLHTVSQTATEILPILGVLWLVVRTATTLYTTFKRKPPSQVD